MHRSAPPPTPGRRSVATTRHSSEPSWAGPSRASSLIIHDIEEQKPEMDTISEEPEYEQGEPMQVQPTPQPVRTRKAKELQTRLGVGRPTIAGGSGARAITKSSSGSKSRRGRSSRMGSRLDAAIPEGEQPPTPLFHPYPCSLISLLTESELSSPAPFRSQSGASHSPFSSTHFPCVPQNNCPNNQVPKSLPSPRACTPRHRHKTLPNRLRSPYVSHTFSVDPL